MKILLTGGSGRLGTEIAKVFPNSSRPPHHELDLTINAKVQKYVALLEPNIVIHSAALTNVREIEKNQSVAWETNVGGTVSLIRSCESMSNDPYFVYISTACVFRGDKGDYVETDTPYPKNFYALTKLVGEQLVLNSHLKNKLVVRTNFVSREKWPYAKAFSDRFGTYLFADDVARALKEVVQDCLIGIVHIAGEKKMSMYELAKLTNPKIEPMTMKDYNGPPLTIDMSLRSVRLKSYRITT